MGDDPDVLRRFAGEVVPAVRELSAGFGGSGADVSGDAGAAG